MNESFIVSAMNRHYAVMIIIVILSMLSVKGCSSFTEYSTDVEVGQKIFNGDGMCFGCHGKDADSHTGLEPIAAQVQPKPPNLRDERSLRYKKDKEIFRFLKDRLHGPVSDGEIRQLIAFLQSIRN